MKFSHLLCRSAGVTLFRRFSSARVMCTSFDSQANTKFKGFGFRVLGFRAWGAFSFSDFRRVYVKVWGFEFCSTTYLV